RGGFFIEVLMLKRLCLAFAGLFALITVAHGAGTVPGFSLVPQFDLSGKVAPGCLLYVIQSGTGSTPQNAYQDSGLTLLQPNPMTCDAAGRLPQWFVADGTIKLRLTTSTGTQIFVGDNLLVVGPSSGGGGGGGTVDPTTISATGDIKTAYGTAVLSGWVRANGRTIGSATSGATERANSDTQALFVYLWSTDGGLAVSGGRGASAAADFAANKTIALPDMRGRVMAGFDDMGASLAGRLTTNTMSGTGIGSVSLATERTTLLTANLPPYTPSGSVTTTFPTTVTGHSPNDIFTPGGCCVGLGGGSSGATPLDISGLAMNSSFAGAAQGGTSTPFSNVQPTILVTIYMKL
ncbi:MAG TPA: hypothetical protein VGE93_17070, partial [Bryobacteraceae bacterium]